MHHLTCVISSLLRSVNLILFTLLLVHLILHALVSYTVMGTTGLPQYPQKSRCNGDKDDGNTAGMGSAVCGNTA